MNDPAPTPEPVSEPPKTDAPEAISDDLGAAGKAAIQKEREARKDLERKLAESSQLQNELAAKVKEFEDRDKTDQQRLADEVAALKQQVADKDVEIGKARHASLRAEVAAAKGVPATSLSGTTREELEACADDLIAWRDANTKRPPKPPAPSGGLKSGASPNGDHSADLKERAAAALRASRRGL
ncbi:hypothetical protein [Nocardia sp. NPDC057030]|uniref:hypothetical protein n=1 Tax=unclassified Nocardia TaxID=2637762 RepID=UPI00363F096F